MRLTTRAALIVAAIAVATPAFAQTSFNVALGAAVPVGSTADAVKTGYTAAVGVGIKPPLAPVGLRIEGMLNGFDGKDSDIGARILAATVNATFSGAVPAPMGYLIGGIGFYNSTATNLPAGFSADSETDFGFNVGGGLNFPLTGFSTYLEARLHIVNGDGSSTKFVPIVFGMRF